MATWLRPVLFSLAGVALGSFGTLFGQYLTSRTTLRQLDLQQVAALRTERKEAILQFLTAVRKIEHEEPTAELVNELWLAQHTVDLLCGEAVRGATYRLAKHVTAVAREEADVPVGKPMAEFMDAAYRELVPPSRSERRRLKKLAAE